MKKIIIFAILTICLIVSLMGCSSKCNEPIIEPSHSQSIDADETELSNIDDEVLSINCFRANTEMQAWFYELVKNNPIDSDYYLEGYDKGTILEMRIHQKKYIEIWLEELSFSCESFSNLLNESDKELFLSYEEQWEKNLLSEFQFIAGVFVNPEYDIHPGSIFPLESNIEYLHRIRERTLYIKYLQFYIELSNKNGGEEKVEFKYQSRIDK